ncbi:hypothetical protein EVAR_13813_1 [Eumeta japonica]|uniref:Uncharacterized protein n=1 Tax=Eumeta variegata TaxID=151549 RepID=A0A4C1U2I8_EUMVA|nr:hypothetical protein EVAR_13813_1 [Eumeta japonica]
MQTLSSLSMCKKQPERLERTKLEYEESKSPHELQKTGFDSTDSGNWPGVEKMTDQQRPFFNSQAVLLAENHSEDVKFRSIERNGRHLTSYMWYGRWLKQKCNILYMMQDLPETVVLC